MANLMHLNRCIALRTMQNIPTRNIYSHASLGIDNYMRTRDVVKSQFVTLGDKFKTKMNEFTKDGPTNMVFTEDLKNMAHICEKKDLELVHKMISKFNSQNKEYRFGTYVFGPVIMRMYYYLDVPNEAFKAFQDPNNEGFFDQLSSFQILLDLLFRHEMYNEMFEIYKYVQNKQLQMDRHPRHVVCLVMAACYKQNTKESYDFACNLWKNILESGNQPMRKTATLFAGLALKQGAPHIALEILSVAKYQFYVTIRNIKAIALANMGRVGDALPILRGVLQYDQPSTDKHTFLQETLDMVTYAIEQQTDNKELKRELDNIVHSLKQRDLIEDKTLDSLLLQEVEFTPNNAPRQFGDQTDKLHTSYQRGRRQPVAYPRQGLNTRY